MDICVQLNVLAVEPLLHFSRVFKVQTKSSFFGGGQNVSEHNEWLVGTTDTSSKNLKII